MIKVDKADKDVRDQRVKDALAIEALAFADMYRAAPPGYVEKSGLAIEVVAGSECFANPMCPGYIFNRALNLGTTQTAAPGDVDRILEWLRKYASTYGIGVDVNTQPANLAQLLESRGLKELPGGISRFVYPGDAYPPLPTTRYDIRRIDEHNREQYAETVQQGFSTPAETVEWFAGIPGRPNWITYLAYDGDVAVATGAMFVSEGKAWLGVAATKAAYRGGGAQRALLARRVSDALDLGIRSIHIETAFPDDGVTFGGSYRNVMHTGFTPLFVRKVFGV